MPGGHATRNSADQSVKGWLGVPVAALDCLMQLACIGGLAHGRHCCDRGTEPMDCSHPHLKCTWSLVQRTQALYESSPWQQFTEQRHSSRPPIPFEAAAMEDSLRRLTRFFFDMRHGATLAHPCSLPQVSLQRASDKRRQLQAQGFL